jgi:hypothetical protein
MNTKIAAMTTVVLLAMGAPLGAQASVDFSDVDIDVAINSMIDEGMAPKTTQIGVEQIILAGHRYGHSIKGKEKKPKKRK